MKTIKLILTIVKNLFLILFYETRNFIRNSSWKRLAITAAVLVLAIGGGIYFWQKYHGGKKITENIYEAMIQTKGQDKYDNDEDRKTFYENGDVMIMFPEGHPWTDAERDEVIVKMKLTPEDAKKLTETVTDDQHKIIELRKYRIRINKLDIDPEKSGKEQGFRDKVFDKGMIEEK